MINYVREAIDYDDYLESENIILGTYLEKKMNLDELARISVSYNDLGEFLASSVLEKEDESSPNKGVNIMTMHSSKGLEFNTVFICGANNSMLPHIMCDNVEEERRLFYVAMTRAKKDLYITYSRNITDRRGNVHLVDPSRFIKEIPVSYLSIVVPQAVA